MGMIVFRTWLDPEAVGRTVGHCPHCLRDVEMSVHRLRSSMGLIPVPSSEARACALCGGLSRYEGTASRLVGIATLTPMALLLVTAGATGAWILASMVGSEFSAEYATIGLVLLAVAAFFGRRTVAGIRRFWGDRGLLPMEGLRTKL